MRIPVFTILLALGCAADASLTAEDSLLAAAINGEEDQLADTALAEADGELLDATRPCDAAGEHMRLRDAADADGSGELDGVEPADTLRHHGPPPHRFAFIRWVYDSNDDGTLDDAERATLLDDHSARCEALQAQLLADFDANGDGTLDETELEAARAAREARREEQGPPEGAPPAGGGDCENMHGRPGQRPGGGPGGRPAELTGAPPPVVDEFDVDADGTLSAGEAATARAALRERIRSGERPGARQG
jgi:hypothetical protein